MVAIGLLDNNMKCAVYRSNIAVNKLRLKLLNMARTLICYDNNVDVLPLPAVVTLNLYIAALNQWEKYYLPFGNVESFVDSMTIATRTPILFRHATLLILLRSQHDV